jgi:hypothetical protein
MRPEPPAPAHAHSPAATRATPDAPAAIPEWLVRLLVLLRLLAQHWALARARRLRGVPAWVHDRPDLPPASAQALAAAVRGTFGTAIAWMCLRRGIGPGHADWPALSRTIVAFGGSLEAFRPGLPALGLQWWESPEIFPGMIGLPAPTPAADALAALLSPPATPDAPPVPHALPAETVPAVSPAPTRPGFARAATGPPTGPPAAPPPQLCHARHTGPVHGQPRRPDSCRTPAASRAPAAASGRRTNPQSVSPARRPSHGIPSEAPMRPAAARARPSPVDHRATHRAAGPDRLTAFLLRQRRDPARPAPRSPPPAVAPHPAHGQRLIPGESP